MRRGVIGVLKHFAANEPTVDMLREADRRRWRRRGR
jgi:hypothetical protein